jgi:glycosyltransferase involved in cell wall biosynthesis
MRFILIANYPPDKQESMKKYAVNLMEGLIKNDADAEIWYPTVFFGYGWKSTISGIGKWLGYVDKWILFPLILRARLMFMSKSSAKQLFFHVCDHSNSPYLKSLPAGRSGITCHDVLAIRGALGFEDAYCPASPTGKILQKWILNNLKKAQILTAVSNLTMNQLLDLCENELAASQNWKVIHNSFNADFWPMDKSESERLVAATGIAVGESFLLHVGSALPRKNRNMLLSMVNVLGDKWNGLICFAGQPIDDKLASEAKDLGLTGRVVSIVKPDHQTLVALYSTCTAFIFPSFSEGFGWPLIEAQACGAPVIASNVEPMPEVSGGTAIHADPDRPEDFARGFLSILDESTRKDLIQSGYNNAKRFDSGLLAKEFIKLYKN